MGCSPVERRCLKRIDHVGESAERFLNGRFSRRHGRHHNGKARVEVTLVFRNMLVEIPWWKVSSRYFGTRAEKKNNLNQTLHDSIKSARDRYLLLSPDLTLPWDNWTNHDSKVYQPLHDGHRVPGASWWEFSRWGMPGVPTQPSGY